MWRTVEAVIKIATNKPSKDIFQHIDGLDGPPHHSQKGDLAPQRAWTKPRNYSLYASGTKNRFTTRELFLTTNKTTISPTQRPLQGLGIGRVHTASPARTSPVRPKLPQRIPSFILREIKPILRTDLPQNTVAVLPDPGPLTPGVQQSSPPYTASAYGYGLTHMGSQASAQLSAPCHPHAIYETLFTNTTENALKSQPVTGHYRNITTDDNRKNEKTYNVRTTHTRKRR